MKAWLGVKDPVMDAVATILDAASVTKEDFKVFVTGKAPTHPLLEHFTPPWLLESLKLLQFPLCSALITV